MHSADLAPSGFMEWENFSLREEKLLLKALPREMGVYVIREVSSFGRLRGQSDIVYIGSSINSDGLRRRIRFYFHPGPSQMTSQRIHRMLRELTSLQIAWITSKDPEHVRRLEKDLLVAYARDHLELPPFNRQG